MSINPSKSTVTAGPFKKSINKNLKTGLNQRTGVVNRRNLFDDNDDDDDDGPISDPMSGKRAVNKEISAEQAALRKRAEAAIREQQHSNKDCMMMYDYDGEYDTFHPTKEDTSKKDDEHQQKESRYISGLLKASEQRKREREVIYDRKIILEQEAENNDSNITNNNNNDEKYVTAAYKRKLQERDLWLKSEQEAEKIEKMNDITKKHRGAEGQLKVASFFGNMNRNLSGAKSGRTGDDADVATATSTDADKPVDQDAKLLAVRDGYISNTDDKDCNVGSPTKYGFMEGFTKVDESTRTAETNTNSDDILQQKYKLREEKIAKARARFFQRRQQEQTQLISTE